MSAYFECDFVADESLWYLAIATPETPIDVWESREVDPSLVVRFKVFADGKRADFNRASHAIIVASKKLGELLHLIAPKDIQLVPAEVDGDSQPWWVVNVLSCLDCIDHLRSDITYYPTDHARTPGKPRAVLKLVIDPSRVEGHHVFLPKGWEVTLIVSDTVKEAMAQAQITGAEFWPV